MFQWLDSKSKWPTKENALFLGCTEFYFHHHKVKDRKEINRNPNRKEPVNLHIYKKILYIQGLLSYYQNNEFRIQWKWRRDLDPYMDKEKTYVFIHLIFVTFITFSQSILRIIFKMFLCWIIALGYIYLSGAPYTHEYNTRLFIIWVWARGHSPNTPGGPKNASGPVGIPQKRAPQAPGNKPNTTEVD